MTTPFRPSLAALAAALAALVAAAACNDRSSPFAEADVVATVDRTPVKSSEVDAWLEGQIDFREEAPSAQVLSSLFDQLLEDRILARWAAERTAAEPALREIGDPVTLLSTLEARALEPIGDAEIERYRSENPDIGRLPERIRIRQIIVQTEEDAKAARRRLVAGEDFATVSEDVSAAPNAERGGIVGTFARGELPEQFESVLFGLELGEISTPIEAPSGYHLFLVEWREGARELSIDELRDSVASRLERTRLERAVRTRMEAILADAVVEIDTSRLSFPYVGRWSQPPSSADGPPAAAGEPSERS